MERAQTRRGKATNYSARPHLLHKILICQHLIVPLSTPRVPTPNAPAPSTKRLLDLRSTCTIALGGLLVNPMNEEANSCSHWSLTIKISIQTRPSIITQSSFLPKGVVEFGLKQC